MWAAARIGWTTLPMSALFFLARARGTALSLVSRKRERVARELERTLGEALSASERRRVARRHFQFVEANRLARLRSSACAPACEIEGLGHLDAALSEGRGAVLLSAHLGYGRLIKPVLVSRRYSVRMVGFTAAGYRVPSRYSRSGGFVRSRVLRLPSIGRKGVDESDIEAGINLRPVLAALGGNDALLFAADGLGAASRHPVTVLGRTMWLTLGAISLSRASGAPILPVFAVDSGRPGVGIRIEICPPLDVSESLPANATLERFALILARYVHDHPHLWSWSNRHFEKHERGIDADEAWRAGARQAHPAAR